VSPRGHARLHTVLAVFWAVQIPPAVVLAIWFPDIWEKVALVYLVVVSIYALAAAHWGAREAASAEDAADDSDAIASEVIRQLRDEGLLDR
jgi:hypothetical protein